MAEQNKNKGFIALYRSMQEHWLWTAEKTTSKFQAWLDLLFSVNYQDKKFMFNGELTEVKRGSWITSIAQLCKRWNWSNSKVIKFLEELEKDEMIVKKSDAKKTVVTIVNYSLYQDLTESKNDAETYQKHNKSISKAYQKHIKSIQLNQDNKDNQDNQDNKFCTELEASSMQNTNHELFIELALNDNSLFAISDSDIQEWSKLYPVVDIKQELRKMKGWLDANPTKRKTRRGIKRFVNNWLARTQDQGGTPGYTQKVVQAEIIEEDSLARARRIRAERAKANGSTQ